MITLCDPMPPTSKRTKPSQSTKYSAKIKTSRGLVRIIAGKHRARRLPVLVHEGLRPTGDRVKETLFNWLMSAVNDATCLDMYAGSGSLGIEALSRGARKVIFVEQDRTVAKQINDNLSTLRELDNAAVLNQNALQASLLEGADGVKHFNIVFIDPPFGNQMVEKSIAKLINQNLLAPNAYIYIETGHRDNYNAPTELTLIKQIKTSQVNACLYQFSQVV